MQKISTLSLFIMLVLCSVTVIGQSSYWVTTDAGTQMEVFPAGKKANSNLTLKSGSAVSSITTLFAANNGGSYGGAVYFDITVGDEPITITAFDINTAELGAMTLSAYKLVGSYVGNTGSSSAWGTPVTGTGTGVGVDTPSHVTLGTAILLNANTTYGIALVLDGSHGFDYTNGTGTNQSYSNSDLTLTFGAASNIPFDGSPFTPRVMNGTIYYTSAEIVPVSAWAIVVAFLLITTTVVVRIRKKKLA